VNRHVIQFPLNVRGITTRVLQAGSEPNAIVFIHGLSTRADRWRGTLQACAGAGLRAIAFDLPGHGLADKSAAFDFSSPALAAYALAVLDALDVDGFHLIGTSLGGHVAGLMTAQAPARARSLMLVASLGIVPISPEVGQAIRSSVRNTSLAGIRAKLANVFADPVWATEALVEEEWRINNSPGALVSLGALGDYVAERLNGDLIADALSTFGRTRPLALLWGAEDRVVPLAVGRAATACLPGVAFHAMPAVGHAPYIEAAPAFDKHLLAFIRATE